MAFSQVRIDHRSHSLSFGTDLGLSQKEEAAEGPTIQSMTSEQIRNQLTVMGRVLSQAVSLISPKQTVSVPLSLWFLIVFFSIQVELQGKPLLLSHNVCLVETVTQRTPKMIC